MRAVIQRVKSAKVRVEGKIISEIKEGYLILVGFKIDDDEKTVAKIAEKIINLRIFSDENDKMNLDLASVKGEILSVSQFTLYADVTTGRRPSFTKSAAADKAVALYGHFNDWLRTYGLPVKTGVFQAAMEVELVNDGPVTIIIDSEDFK